MKHYNDQNKIDEFQQKIQQRLVFKMYYKKWKCKKEKINLENNSIKLSIDHYSKRINKKLFDHWIIYAKISKRKKLMETQADWFNEMRLKFFAFKVWQQKYNLIIEENKKNNKAIIHWAWQLEKKCFLNWLLYVNTRKLKKKRYDDAINDRRNEILKSVIKCFIVYSNDSRDRRFKQLVNQKQQQLTIQNQLELKYYHRWREYFKTKQQTKSKLNILFNKVDAFERRINSNSYLPIVPLQPGKQTPILSFTDTPAIRVTNRPQPRKPAFLLDSVNVDDTAGFKNTNNNTEKSILSMVTAKESIENKSIIIPVITTVEPFTDNKLNKPVLLPPSAFTVLPEAKILSSTIEQQPIIKTQSRCSSTTTTFDTEMHQEMTIQKLNNENFVKKNAESYNLIKLKERLENLAIKKEKLK